jgi:hypothetical protein
VKKGSIENWIGYEFRSSTTKTPEFKAFAKDFKAAIKTKLLPGIDLAKYSVGHFYVTGFIQNKEGKIVYFSVPDVRYQQEGWFERIMVRTARTLEDYSGGQNHFIKFNDFGDAVHKLMKQP